MKSLVRAVSVVGEVFGLVIGSDFTSPYSETMQRDPYLLFHANQ